MFKFKFLHIIFIFLFHGRFFVFFFLLSFFFLSFLKKTTHTPHTTQVNNEKVSFMGSDDSSMLPNMVTVHNNIDSDAPWDAVRQLTDALTKRISDGSQQTLESVMNGRIN